MPTELTQIIRLAFFRNNRPLEPETAKFIVADFQTILKKRYPKLTIKEVEYIFDKGTFGAYGENYGLSEVTFCKWIDSYLQSDERQAANEEQKRQAIAALPQRATITNEEQRKIDIQILIRQWTDYQKRGSYILEFGSTYDILQRLNIYIFTKEDWIAAYKRANEHNERKRQKYSKTATTITDYIKARFTTSERECKRECVFAYFDGLIENGIDLMDKIKEICNT